MKTVQYILFLLFSFAFLFIACKKEDEIKVGDITPGTVPVALTGVSARNDGVTGTNIYLKAFLSGGSPIVYIGETLISFAGGLSSTPKDVVFPSATPYYPVGGSASIDIFAYTGKLNDDKMVILAGNGANYDAVLSNYGIDFYNDTIYNPGTPGSSDYPAKELIFRHVMTQLIVDVRVNDTEQPDSVTPHPKSIQFTIDGVAARGEYPIRGNTTDVAVASTGNYTISLGTNYLVANGQNLRGKHLSSLIIDDYTATAADLAEFTIENQSGDPNLLLMPGYSYNLTFIVNRLKITGIQIRQVPWQAHELTANDVNYVPHLLNVSLGTAYSNTGTDAITKIVLHRNNEKMYVGESETAGGPIGFVTLPVDSVTKVDLYTNKGLLLSTPVTTEYVYAGGAATLSIPNLSAGGMLPVNPALPYNATSNPYNITTALQFININKNLAASYQQSTVVNMDWVDDAGFNGFGNFTGTYNGNQLWISNLNINGAGLFSSNSGVLRDVRLFSGVINAAGQNTAGSICGTNTGTIVSCFNEALINNATDTVGGICGTNQGFILGCINTGNVNNGNIVGGICGSNTNTGAGAIAASINTGYLSNEATIVGGLCGISTASSNNVIRTSFWLIGTAASYIGETEYAVGSHNVQLFDVSALDPFKLRNGLNAGETDNMRVVSRLNMEYAQYAQWRLVYHYIINPAVTGSTWPVSVEM